MVDTDFVKTGTCMSAAHVEMEIERWRAARALRVCDIRLQQGPCFFTNLADDPADDLADDPRRLSSSDDEISNQDDECMKNSHQRVVGGAAVGAAALAGAVT